MVAASDLRHPQQDSGAAQHDPGDIAGECASPESGSKAAAAEAQTADEMRELVAAVEETFGNSIVVSTARSLEFRVAALEYMCTCGILSCCWGF